MRSKRRRFQAFTLIEMMIVMSVIGIIIAFILKAAMGGIRAAEQKATIALIAKLEAALTDRVQALSTQNPEPTPAHILLATLTNSIYATAATGSPAQFATTRAQVIANYDNMRAELPDVFVVINPTPSGAVYPLNFAAMPFGTTGTPADYYLPLGSSPVGGAVPSTGIYGASYSAAAAIYEQLGYGPQGTDGADNNNNGYIDEYSEGIIGLNAGQQSLIQQRLASHKHNTARAEVLYAILVNGGGPLGSSFTKDDFTSKEVMDTDNDGLLEFVDAWGQPLQFYRWPIAYHSDQQRGFPNLDKITQDLGQSLSPGPFSSIYEARDVNPMDPNQQLLSPAWFAADSLHANQGPGWASASGTVSGAAMAFQNHFHTLVDPFAITAGASSYQTYWDRSTAAKSTVYGTLYPRRAYYSRFLVVSGGVDKQPGTAMLGVNYQSLDDRNRFPLPGGGTTTTRDGTGGVVLATVANVIQIENQGGMIDPNRSGAFYAPTFGSNYRNDTNTLLEYFAADDITSQNYQSLGVPQ